MNNSGWFRPAFVRSTLAAGGILYVLAGAALLLTPDWFLANIGAFPPYNRHYMGDTGSFTLALGVGMLLAARDPLRQRAMLAAALVGTLLHTANHAYGDIVLGELPPEAVLLDVAPLALYAVLLVAACAMVFRQSLRARHAE
jgi:hypothetical protein